MKLNRDAKIPLQCPKCKHKFQETVGRLQDDPVIICPNPNCSESITFDQESLERISSEISELVRNRRFSVTVKAKLK